MRILETLYHWFVYSSVNAENYSLTLKGVVGVIIAALTYFFNLRGIAFDSAALTTSGDLAISLAQNVLLTVSTIVALVGVIRKVYTTVNETNDVLNTR